MDRELGRAQGAKLITRAITTAVLEQTLHCRDRAA
jgi:hypothetical protein